MCVAASDLVHHVFVGQLPLGQTGYVASQGVRQYFFLDAGDISFTHLLTHSRAGFCFLKTIL